MYVYMYTIGDSRYFFDIDNDYMTSGGQRQPTNTATNTYIMA